jgi:hypothetical protein
VTINEVWNQRRFPVIWRQAEAGDPALHVRLPYSPDNRAWLKQSRHREPKWDTDQRLWRVPRAWFSEVVNQCLSRYRGVYVIQPHNPGEKCAPACWEAKGEECECSCMGARHGSGRPEGRWYVVSDSLAVRWEGRSLYWTLLRPV